MKPITERDIQNWLMQSKTEIWWARRTSRTAVLSFWEAYDPLSGSFTGRGKFAVIRKCIRAEKKMAAMSKQTD